MTSARALVKGSLFVAICVLLVWVISPPKPQRLTTEPSVSEITGRYTLSNSRFGMEVDAEIQSKAKDAYIELHPDGHATLNNVPIIPESSSGTFTITHFQQGTCRYEIGAQGGTATQTFFGVYLRDIELPDPMWAPRFKRLGPSLTLSFEYFNGDFTERMVFTRQEAMVQMVKIDMGEGERAAGGTGTGAKETR